MVEWMEGFSFCFRAVRGGSVGVFPLFLGVRGRVGWWRVAFRGRNGRPGRSGAFRVSVGEVLRFKDVEIFAFSGMLDFQMFECFCFGLGDFAKSGKLNILRALTFWHTCRNYNNPR